MPILDHQTALVKTATGFSLYLDPRDISMAPRLLLDGEWEPHVTTALRHLVHAGNRCVNVGANVGYHALWMARLAGPAGKVVAIEPSAHLSRLLARNARINGPTTIEIHQCAVGRTEGTGYLQVPEAEHGGAACERFDFGCARIYSNRPGEEVPVHRLDDFRTLEGPLDVLLVDAEGAEVDVWYGMPRLLAESPALRMIIEFDPTDHDDPEGWLAEVQAAGFTLGHVDLTGALVASSIQELCTGKQLHLVARRD